MIILIVGWIHDSGNGNDNVHNHQNKTNCNHHNVDDENQTIGQKRFQNIGKNSFSSAIGSYKSAITKNSRRLGFEFNWQPIFYEHIVRNSASFEKISNCIVSNPKKWSEDKFYEKE